MLVNNTVIGYPGCTSRLGPPVSGVCVWEVGTDWFLDRFDFTPSQQLRAASPAKRCHKQRKKRDLNPGRSPYYIGDRHDLTTHLFTGRSDLA